MAWLIGRTAIVPARNPDPKDSGGPSEGRCNPVSLGNVRSDEATMKYMTPMFGGPMRRGESFNAYKRRHARGGLRRNPSVSRGYTKREPEYEVPPDEDESGLWDVMGISKAEYDRRLKEEQKRQASWRAEAEAAKRAREAARVSHERSVFDSGRADFINAAYNRALLEVSPREFQIAEEITASKLFGNDFQSAIDAKNPEAKENLLRLREGVLKFLNRSVDYGHRPGDLTSQDIRRADLGANRSAMKDELRAAGLEGKSYESMTSSEKARYNGIRARYAAKARKRLVGRTQAPISDLDVTPEWMKQVKVTPAAEKVVGPDVAEALAQKVEEILPPGTKAVIKTDAKQVAKASKSGSKKPSRREMLDRITSRAGLTKETIRLLEGAGLVFPKQLKKFLAAQKFGPRNRVGGKVTNLPSYRKAYNAAVRAGVDPDLAKMFSSPEDLEDIAALTKMGTVQGATRASKRGSKSKSSSRKSARGKAGSSRRRNPYSVDGASRVPSVRGGFSGSSAVPGSLRIRSNPMARYGAEDIRLMKKRKKSRKSRRNPAIGSVVKSMGDFVIHSGLPLVGGVVAIRSINEGANYLGSKIPGVSQFMPLVVGAGTLFGGFFLAQASDAGDLDRIPVINKIFGRRRSDDGFGMGRMEGRGDMIKVVAGVATLLGLVKAYSNVIPGLSSVAQYVGLNEIQYRPAMNGVGEFQYSTNGLNEVQYMPQLNGLNEVQYMPALNGLAGPAYTTDPNFMNSSYLPDHVAGINGLPNFMG